MLLSIGMVLANLVTLVFWHAVDIRKGVRQAQQSVQLVRDILELEGASDSGISQGRLLSVSLESGGAACGIIRQNGTRYTAGEGQCLAAFSDMLHAGRLSRQGSKSTVVFTHNPFFAFLAPDSYAYVWLHLPSQGQPHDGIGMVVPLFQYWRNLFQQEQVILVYVLFNAMVFSVLVFFRMRRLIMRPLDRLVDLVSHHSLSEKDVFLSYSGSGEFAQLSNALYTMVGRIQSDHEKLAETVRELESKNSELQETRNEMIKTERLAAAGQLTAGLAHEIGNPLGIVLGYVGLLKRPDLDSHEQKEYLERIEGELERIHHLIQQLLCYCRQTQVDQQRTAFSMNKMVDEVLELTRMRCGKDVHFTTRYDDQACIFATANEIRQTLLNCLLNAVDSFEGMTDTGDKHIHLATEHRVDESGEWVEDH